jgi:chromosome segregation ATPase
MDLERTMQFIVDTLADVAVKQQVAEVRAQRAEQRMDKLERQMKGIQTLVKTGMKKIIDVQKAQKVTNQKLSALTDQVADLAQETAGLAESQKDTDRKFKSWLESMRSNGHKGSNGSRKKPN